METTIKWNGQTIIIKGGSIYVQAYNFERDGFVKATNCFSRNAIKHMLRTGVVTVA